jgi:hypothetical protein
MPEALPILILSDGRAGHYNLSEGIAAAVARRRPVEISRCQVRRGRWPGPVLGLATNRSVAPEFILSRVYGLDPAVLGTPRLIVSAGAETLAANIAAARITGARNVFYGSLRNFRPEHFALALTSYAEDAREANQRMMLKPNRLDPDQINGPSVPAGRAPARAALLIGGDAGTIAYSEADWDRLIDFVSMAARELGVRWVVSTSRRTPDAVADRFAGMVRRPEAGIETFIDVRTPGAPGMDTIFAVADAVVATADSSSMISEAVWARRPVLAVSPTAFRLDAKEQAYRRYLADNGWSRTLAIALLSPATFVAALGQIRVYAGNAQEDLAALLATTVPDVFM